MIAAQAASKPISVKSLIFSRSTSMPTTRDTSFESPMNSTCSPKRWRLRMNHRKTTMSAVHNAWIEICCSQATLGCAERPADDHAARRSSSSAPRSA